MAFTTPTHPIPSIPDSALQQNLFHLLEQESLIATLAYDIPLSHRIAASHCLARNAHRALSSDDGAFGNLSISGGRSLSLFSASMALLFSSRHR